MRVLVADKLPEASRSRLAELGCQVSFQPELGADDLGGAISDHEILIVRSTKVNAAVFEAATSLELVIRAGAGYNTIDVAAASASGVYVANCPGKNAIAVAELAIGLLLALDRRIPAAHAELAAGKWNKKEFGKARGLFGRTLGVVGLGTIGIEVVRRAQALGMNVVGWSRSLSEEAAALLGIERAPSPVELARRCDAVSIHLALTPETRGVIGTDFFCALPQGAAIVNTSRGGVVDEAALVTALDSRELRYGADVFDGEPGSGVADFDSPITGHPRVVCTPHIGASTDQAQDAVAEEALRIIESYARQGTVPNCVNLCETSPARWQLSVRHLDRVGVLAGVLSTLREAQINVEEVQNVIFDGATAACATLQLGGEPPAAALQALRSTPHVLGVQLRAL